jgi:hypothetical protein
MMGRRSTKPTTPSSQIPELVEASASLDETPTRIAPKQPGGLISPVFRNSNPNMKKEAQVRAEVETLRSLGKDELRARWTKMFGKAPPPALTKDLLGRMLFGEEQVPHINFRLHCHRVAMRKFMPICTPASPVAVPYTVL